MIVDALLILPVLAFRVIWNLIPSSSGLDGDVLESFMLIGGYLNSLDFIFPFSVLVGLLANYITIFILLIPFMGAMFVFKLLRR